MRRVVIGERNGQAVVASDERLTPITIGMMPGAEFYGIWGEDGPAAVPSDGTVPGAPAWFPPASGYRHEVIVIPPDGVAPTVDPAAGIAEMRTKLPGLADVMDSDHPGMHATDTVDINVVLDGEIYLRLDDGTEVLPRPRGCSRRHGRAARLEQPQRRQLHPLDDIDRRSPSPLNLSKVGFASGKRAQTE